MTVHHFTVSGGGVRAAIRPAPSRRLHLAGTLLTRAVRAMLPRSGSGQMPSESPGSGRGDRLDIYTVTAAHCPACHRTSGVFIRDSRGLVCPDCFGEAA